MKAILCLVALTLTGVAHADYKITCNGRLSNTAWTIDSGTFSVELPYTAYKMNGNKPGKMKENCILQPTFTNPPGFSTFQCYRLTTSMVFADNKITEAIYKKDFVKGGKEARAYLSELSKSEEKFTARFSTFDNVDEETPIELSSYKETVTCAIKEL